jgi:hypothetical protein
MSYLSEIRTHGLSDQAINAHASDSAATGTGNLSCYGQM